MITDKVQWGPEKSGFYPYIEKMGVIQKTGEMDNIVENE